MYLSSQKPSIMKRIEENSLRSTLKKLGIQHVYVAGLALDYCVKYTTLQALRRDFETSVIIDATKPVTEKTGAEAVHAVTAAGASLVQSCKILGTC